MNVTSDQIEASIFKLKEAADLEKAALNIFRYQWERNQVYRKYCDLLKIQPTSIQNLQDIPFLPIQFFKNKSVKSGEFEAEVTFKSSGTGGMRSQHMLKDVSLYRKSFTTAFEYFYGKAENYCILALLPSYLEQGDSSLVYMCSHLIEKSGHPQSGFYLNEYEALNQILQKLKQDQQKTLLIGVSYALLDFTQQFKIEHFPELIVMETGGMKGRKKEMVRAELHQELKNGFGLKEIHSEYGMTELLSQAYAKKDGIFHCPPWMKILIRKQDAPFDYCASHESGGINIIDLANLHSISFIQTDDLGKIVDAKDGSFQVLGRFDQSEVRGCNLLVS